MTDPLVSIVIDNYNYAEFVGEAIESALAQTYRHLEILVVDDGSTDDSASIIGRYADRVEVVLKQNGGQASAINLGAARARGEIVIFLDADDVLLPHIVAAVADAYRAQPNLAKAEYMLAVVDAAGRRTGELRPSEHLRPPSGDLRRYELACPFDLVWMSMSGNAFSARALAQVLPVPEDSYGRTGADWYMTHMVALFGPVVFLDTIGAYYRVHGSNAFAAHQFELQGIRHAVQRMRITTEYLERKATEIGLLRQRGSIGVISCAEVAMRMMSVRLEPGEHPIGGETRFSLIALGLVAVRRRIGVSPLFKLAMLSWMVAMTFAPREAALWLAQVMLAPQRRPNWVNRLLSTI